jgi:hypothetical protein
MRVLLRRLCRIGYHPSIQIWISTLMTISDQLRKAIKESKQTQEQIEQKTGVPQSTISRFLNGSNLRIHQCDLLAAHLKMELRPIDSKGKR